MEQRISRRNFLKAVGFNTAAMALGSPEALASEMSNAISQENFDCEYAQIIIYGQSLASGTETKIAITTEPLKGVYMVGNHSHWYKSDIQNGLYPCRNEEYESPIVATVNHFATMYRRERNPDQKFIANSTGLGGRSIERLSKGCTSYGYEYLYQDAFLDYLDDTKTSVKIRKGTVKCVAVIWMQGEYNYNGYNKGQGFVNGTDSTTDKDEYKAYLHQLKKDMQADIMKKYGQTEPPLFFVYQTGGAFITNGTSSINMAQQEMVAECEDAILLGSAMPCPRFNGGHMSSNGYRWQGEMIGKQLAETFLHENNVQTVKDRNITIEGNQVRIEYDVPVPPLVADNYTVQEQPNYGYSVYVDGVGVPVEQVEIQDTQVILTCEQELHGIVAVKYAGNAVGNRDHRGIGNIRDSDTTLGIYPYVDDTDEISSSNNTIDYRPKTASGEPLAGSQYPLYNWANHLYREIIVDDIQAADFTPQISNTKAIAGDVLTLTVAYTPSNANGGKKITWESSDESKAKIEENEVTILSETDDTVTITGTLENGTQHSVEITILSEENRYSAYYGYWDFTGGEKSNILSAKNLTTKQNDNILEEIDGITSGYLTEKGLTLDVNSAVRIPVVPDMPDGVEIEVDFTMADGPDKNKGFLSLASGSTNKLEFGTERYAAAWPAIHATPAEDPDRESEVGWRFATDAGGTALGNTSMWFSGNNTHQQLRLRLNTSGGGEFAMRYYEDLSWHTWDLPTYAGAEVHYPCFQSFKEACDSILIGNRATMDFALPGTIIRSVSIREYNG